MAEGRFRQGRRVCFFRMCAALFLLIFGMCCGEVQAAGGKAKQKRGDFSIAADRTVYQAGESFQMKVTGKRAGNTAMIQWSCSNPRAAEISADGVVTVKEAGNCRITAVNENRRKAVFDFCAVNYQIPQVTTEDVLTVSVQAASGQTYAYTVYNQYRRDGAYGSYTAFLAEHGCAVSSLTALLSSRVPQLAENDPADTIEKVEKSVFSKQAVKRNYSKRMRLQRPVSLNGISKILKKYKIKHKYVSRFSKKKAEKQITEHLLQGKPVVLTVRRGKWARTYHTMLLIGMTPGKKALVADSANRRWAGQNQRIKYAKVSELLKYAWSSGKSGSVYWNGYSGCGGYILVS